MLFVNWTSDNFRFKIIVLFCDPSSIIFVFPFRRNMISSFFHLLHNQYMVNKKMIRGICKHIVHSFMFLFPSIAPQSTTFPMLSKKLIFGQ